MPAKQTVLAWDFLTVRSVKAEARRKEAVDVILLPETTYSLTTTEKSIHLWSESATPVKISVDDISGLQTVKFAGMPVFYDQTTYNFTIKLPEAEEAWIYSIIAKWHEDSEWNANARELRIPINFGNDLGDFELNWRWLDASGQEHSGRFRAQVFSTKLDVRTHFDYMLRHADKHDWIDLDLLKQSTWNFGLDTTAESSQQTWLRLFQDEYATLDTGFRELTERHRKRLKAFDRYVAPERIKRFSPKLEEKVAEGLLEGREQKYRVESRVLEADIPENRLMKSLLKHTLARLRVIEDRISSIDRISDVFKAELAERGAGFEQTLSHRFWRGIGAFHGMRGESLILSQDPLYARVRRSWYRLQFGMRLLDKDLNGGIQNVAQLYEIWCLLKLDKLITESFQWQANEKPERFLRPDDDDWELTEPRTGSLLWKYTKKNYPGVELELLFQPTAGINPSKSGFWDDVIAIPIAQRPDIVLRLRRNDLPQQPVYTWIFDAKYRIDKAEAPPDAVNQMHQYRDAILWQQETFSTVRERESIGAYVLYPGEKTDAQFAGISKTNIGAIPLRPTPNLEDVPNALHTVLNDLLKASLEAVNPLQAEEKLTAQTPRPKSGLIKHVAVPVAEPRAPIIAQVQTKGEMRTGTYWQTCRLYRLPVERAPLETVLTWTHLVPDITNGDWYMYEIKNMSPQPLSRSEVETVYKLFNVEINPEPENAKSYHLFLLGNRVPVPPRELLGANVAFRFEV